MNNPINARIVNKFEEASYSSSIISTSSLELKSFITNSGFKNSKLISF